MELIDNISRLLGDDLKKTLRPGARLKVAASCFSMYAFEALKAELEKIEELDFIRCLRSICRRKVHSRHARTRSIAFAG